MIGNYFDDYETIFYFIQKINNNLFFYFYSLFLKMDIALQGTIPVRILKTDLIPSKVYDVAYNPSSLTLSSLVIIYITIIFFLLIHNKY